MNKLISWFKREKLRFYLWRKHIKQEFIWWLNFIFPRTEKVYILGTPNHTNLGDSAIVMAQIAFLRKNGWKETCIKEISWEQYREKGDTVRRWISRNGLIAQLGGGNMGNQWLAEEMFHRSQVEDYPRNPMIIFPQTVYYTKDSKGTAEAEKSAAVYNGKQNLTMVAREKISYDEMKRLYPDTKILLAPDIVLSSSMEDYGAVPQKREGILLLMRNDAESAMDAETKREIEGLVANQKIPVHHSDMHGKYAIDTHNRADAVREKMEEIAGAKLVITDRLHGMVFAAVTGTPCIVFSNYNHKVRGTYEWIQYLPYIRYAETAADVERFLPELLAMENCVFDNEPLMPYFEPLAKVVREYADH